MASLPLVRPAARVHAGSKQPGAHRPEFQDSRNKGVTIMAIIVLLFFVAIAVASGAGLTADSRDSADWRPSMDGLRAPDRY
jgi:hypothetical protein